MSRPGIPLISGGGMTERGYDMKCRNKKHIDPARVSPTTSRVKAMLSWLVEADREFRVTQSKVEHFYRRF